MSNERESFRQIEYRHGRDKWKDAGFIALALLLTALSLGAMTSKAMGKPRELHGTVSVVYSNLEIGR
jgi:hypothetical protein